MNVNDNVEKGSEVLREENSSEAAQWRETIWSRISHVTAPLTERFESYYAGTSKQSDREPPDGVFQRISDFAAPLSEPSAESKENEENHASDTSHDGIMDRITGLASPLTDFIESYTEQEEPEESASKENVLQKVVKDRFDKKRTPKLQPQTWKDKIVEKIDTLTSTVSDQFNIPVTLNGMDMNGLSSKDQIILAAIGVLIFIMLFLLVRRRRAKRRDQLQSPTARRNRVRTASHDSPRNRARSGSFDAFLRNNSFTRARFGTEDDPLEQAVVSNKEDTPLTFGGAGVPCISYETWTPPMQWTEASRMLLPVNTAPKQERKVTLDFQKGTLTREQQGEQNKETFAMTDLSLHVKTPTVGGVLEVYLKETPKDEWMEHTFKSAHQAAQFQQDLINYRVVGESIMNMYESLELIQKGSMAHDGKECVLHDDTSDTKKSAVAWDDTMRCFAGIKSLRKALDLDLVHRMISDKSDDERTDAVAEDYVNNRLLLGRFDFYRLFVPNVEPSALPQPDSSPTRVNELLERRKLVARASVMVQAFVQARTVANKGWNLNMDLPEDTFTKRLAYDEDIDNVQRDSTATNEYYEATVSRDVRCEVHSARHLEKPGSSVLSKYQAFSLVGSQVFELPPSGERHALSHRKDPVLSLPSLRKLVEAHSELDFFVCAFFPAGLRVAIVNVFVRSLPRGVDSSFDIIVSTVKVFLQVDTRNV